MKTKRTFLYDGLEWLLLWPSSYLFGHIGSTRTSQSQGGWLDPRTGMAVSILLQCMALKQLFSYRWCNTYIVLTSVQNKKKGTWRIGKTSDCLASLACVPASSPADLARDVLIRVSPFLMWLAQRVANPCALHHRTKKRRRGASTHVSRVQTPLTLRGVFRVIWPILVSPFSMWLDDHVNDGLVEVRFKPVYRC